MHRYFAVALLLTVPAFGQMLRGTDGACFSNFNNFDCIPIDGGKVWTWNMYNPGQTDCVSHNLPNNATFTGSAAITMSCGGSAAPTIQATGMSLTGNSWGALSSTVDLGTGFTQVSVFKPNSTTGFQYFGSLNFNVGTGTTFQYAVAISPVGTGDFTCIRYATTNTYQQFSSTGTPVVTTGFQMITGGFTNGTASSARLWYNQTSTAGSWTNGTGTVSQPAVQAENDIGGAHAATSNSGLGTIGYIVMFDHNINVSAVPFIYRAMYRAMQFRAVAMPAP